MSHKSVLRSFIHCSLRPVSAETVILREKKWIKMLNNWDHYMERKPKKVHRPSTSSPFFELTYHFSINLQLVGEGEV